MDHYREIKNNLVWHNEGKFEVELVNGVITNLNFCEPGKGPHDEGKALTSTNYKYLQSVYTCLGDLFAFIEQENQRLGYSFARAEESRNDEELTEKNNQLIETKLRSLVKVDQQNCSDGLAEDNKLRDIG